MSVHVLQRRIDRMLAARGQKGTKRLKLFVQEGLSRKLTIVRYSAINHGELPADFSEQCRAIDQDIERRMSPAERAARAAYQGERVESIAAFKENSKWDDMPYYPEVLDAVIEQCRRDIELVYHVRLVN